MHRVRYVPMVGATSCFVLLLLLIAPLRFVDELALDVYYQRGLLDAYTVGALSIGTIVFLTLGLGPESDHALYSGAALVLAACSLAVSVVWATTVPPEVVMELSRVDALGSHRWVIVALSALALVAGALDASVHVRD